MRRKSELTFDMDSKSPTQDIGFWQERLKTASKSIDAIGIVYSWFHINNDHRNIIGHLIKPSDKVLDAGCGTGRLADTIVDNYIGIDFVPEFIEIAKQKHPNKEFQIVDLREPLPYEDNQFDWAILASIKGTMMQVIGEDWYKIEEELKRVAKKILFLNYTDSDKYEVI